MKWISFKDKLPSDIDLLKQGQIRLVSKARARKLRKKGIACWWSAELYSRVRTGIHRDN
jgi:hypothetical protein